MQAETLSTLPSLWRLYAAAAVKRGRSAPGLLPVLSVSVSGVRIDHDQVRAYNRVCGFQNLPGLSPTFLHILAFPLHMHLLVHHAMPLTPMGLVHVRNSIRQSRPVGPDELLWIDCAVGETRQVNAGLEFDLTTRIEASGEPVWESVSTNLSRMPGSGNGKPKKTSAPLPEPDEIWSLPANLGRRYGAVSGDRNPIHLYPVTSRLFGFRKPIAHGMWSKARCLAALMRLPLGHKAFCGRCAVSKPRLYLPSNVCFSQAVDRLNRALIFNCIRKGGRPHLTVGCCLALTLSH